MKRTIASELASKLFDNLEKIENEGFITSLKIPVLGSNQMDICRIGFFMNNNNLIYCEKHILEGKNIPLQNDFALLGALVLKSLEDINAKKSNLWQECLEDARNANGKINFKNANALYNERLSSIKITVI